MAGAAVEVRSLRHEFDTRRGRLTVIDDLDLDVADGEFVAFVGRSGAGKTTLLSLIGGLDRIQAGSIVVGTTRLHEASGDSLAAFRRSTIGFVFQDYGLVPTLTALENVELAATFAGRRPAERRDRARSILAAVGLADRVDHRPAQLSGGESQRVAIARSLINEPAVLLADEPTGNLDGASAATVLDLLRAVHRERGCTLIVVTHSDTVAAQADRVVRLTTKTEAP